MIATKIITHVSTSNNDSKLHVTIYMHTNTTLELILFTCGFLILIAFINSRGKQDSSVSL